MDANMQARLCEPFAVDEVKWKPQVVRGNRAMTICYVDARCVMDRLDEIFGTGGWQDAYQVLPNNSVVCKLRVRIADEWVEKSDVGSQSDQPDEGDRLKSAFSDALKRAAVKYGIGRYLYRLPQQWVDYDPQTRQLKDKPGLPAWAIPKGAHDAATPRPGHPAKGPNGTPTPAAQRQAGKAAQPQSQQQQAPAQQPAPAKPAPAPAAAATISREQWEQVKGEMKARRVSPVLFLGHFKIARPGDLPAARFGEMLRLVQNPPPELLMPPPEDEMVETPIQ